MVSYSSRLLLFISNLCKVLSQRCPETLNDDLWVPFLSNLSALKLQGVRFNRIMRPAEVSNHRDFTMSRAVLSWLT